MVFYSAIYGFISVVIYFLWRPFNSFPLQAAFLFVHQVIFQALQCLSKCTPWAKDYFGMLRRWSALKMCKKPLVNRPSIKDLANLFLGSVHLNSVLSGVRVHMYLRFPPVRSAILALSSRVNGRFMIAAEMTMHAYSSIHLHRWLACISCGFQARELEGW